MAHCISLDETIPKKSIDVATNNVTHIHYGNSSSQTNNSKVGCYQNAESVGHTCVHANGSYVSASGSNECPNCHNNTADFFYATAGASQGCGGSGGQRIGYYCGYCAHGDGYAISKSWSHTVYVTQYACPYTAGTTLMSIGVMHMDKVGARRTLTINFDDQITSAGSVISYAWNTGATTQSITVNQRGTYYCDVTWRETKSQVNHTVRLTYTF